MLQLNSESFEAPNEETLKRKYFCNLYEVFSAADCKLCKAHHSHNHRQLLHRSMYCRLKTLKPAEKTQTARKWLKILKLTQYRYP